MFPRFLLSGLVALPLMVATVTGAAAQMADPRVAQLEEQVRHLTGTIEELNFQILQMQDQLRRMQEDNELRFQELEQRRSDAGSAPQQKQSSNVGANGSGDAVAIADEGSGDDAFYSDTPKVEEGSQVRGEPPRNFGTITFDEKGNASGAGLPAQQTDGTSVASLQVVGGTAAELYQNSYQFILSGDYSTAEAGFRSFIEQYPQDEHMADAYFWLGEALLAQQRPREAAETFLSASRDYPQARKAPDTLLKLGVSLAAMGQREVACATYAEVLQRYPQATDALKQRVGQEQAASSC